MIFISCCFVLVKDVYDKDLLAIENETDRIRMMIEQRYLDFVQMIEHEKNTLLFNIEAYIRSLSST
jgi:hypothetical protein